MTDTESPERPQTEESRIGRLAARLITLVPKPMMGVRETMFKRMAVKSIENYHKTAGGDAVALNAKAGQQLDLEPVKYRSPEEVDEGEKHGWKVKGRDKAWNPAKDGASVSYLGRAPFILAEDDDHVEAGWLAPRIGQAVELDNYWPLFTNASINAVIDAGGGGAGAGAARADGGMGLDFELDDPGEWAGENVVDLGSGAGYDGMVISTDKAREWTTEDADSEHMQMQEDRGFLRGLANGDEGPSMFKFILLWIGSLLAALALILLGPELISGGGGGSGINPLMINALSVIV